MFALFDFSIRRPGLVVFLALMVVLALAPGLGRLKLRTDGHALVVRNAPDVRYDRVVRDEFGIEDSLVVLIRARHAEGIFNPGTLQLVRELTADFRQLSGLRPENVVSLATEKGFRYRPGSLQFQNLLEPPLTTRPELEQLRDDLRRLKIFSGTLVSDNGQATVILLGAPPTGDRTALYRAIQEIITVKCAGHDEEISVIGAPAAETLLGLHILDDLGVPRALLGVKTHEASPWRVPSNFFEARSLVARGIGLVPVAMVCMGLVFLACFRRAVPAVLPLLEVGACLVAVFGVMGYAGVPVYLTTAVMPVILTAMGVADEIYIYSRYVSLLRDKPQARPGNLVRETMEELWRPIVNMSATTAIGFLSFVTSNVGPVRAFGAFTALGILFCLLWTLIVDPALLVLLKPRLLLPRRGGPLWLEGLGRESALRRMNRVVVRRRWWVLAGLAGLIALAPFGVRRILVQDSWIDGFDPASEFFRETEYMNKHFHGTHVLLVTVDAGWEKFGGELTSADMDERRYRLATPWKGDPRRLVGSWISISAAASTNRLSPRPAMTWQGCVESAVFVEGGLQVNTLLRDGSAKLLLQPAPGERLRFEIESQPHQTPALLRRIAALGEFIRQRRDCQVGGVLTPVDFVETTAFTMRPDDPAARRIPDTPADVRILWHNYRVIRGLERLAQTVNTNFSRSVVTVFLKDGNFVDTGRLLDAIRGYEREHLAPLGVKLDFAGDTAVSQGLIRSIVRTQVQSLVWSLLGILMVTSLLFRSVRCGIYCTLPSALAVLVNFAVMGWAGIPLGVATSMFAAMTLGMGVDFAIHVLERFQAARHRMLAVEAALAEAVGGIGPAVMTNAVAVGLGFGVLMLSQVPANARLGALVVLGVLNCLVASLLALPVLFRLWPPRAQVANVR